MVFITKRKSGNTEYYYLGHSVKDGKGVEKIVKYLGKKIPRDIDSIKKNFLFEIYKKKWFEKFDLIKKNFGKELSKLPKEIKEKRVEQFAIKFTYNTNRIEGSTL